ncbi:phosphoglycerate dehydrogenase [bacterium]|nr:phosphoglycerate dehydrogenase [bacterium]
MSSNSGLIAVASRSFSQDEFLRNKLSEKYPSVKFNETGKSLQGDELVSFLKGAEKAIVALEKINDDTLKYLPDLKVISKYGVGLDNISFEDMFKHNIQLAWQGGVNRRSVAELAMHFILGCVRGSFHSHHEVQKGTWTQFKGQNLSGKTIGILGLGYVGQELVPFLKPYGVKILAYDLFPKDDYCIANGIQQTTLENVLKESDVVTIHLPLTSKTKALLNRESLMLMKKGSFLVNTARGGMVDESALYDLLSTRHIQSAAFDVFEKEPPVDQKLFSLDNFFSTAHIGGSSIQSIRLMGQAAIEGLSNPKPAKPENFFNYPL